MAFFFKKNILLLTLLPFVLSLSKFASAREISSISEAFSIRELSRINDELLALHLEVISYKRLHAPYFTGDPTTLVHNPHKNVLNDEQITALLKAYQLNKKDYGEDNIKTANLAFNLAEQYIYGKHDEGKEKAKKLLLPALKIFEKEYGQGAVELAKFYILLGQAMPYSKHRQAKSYFEDALDIADNHKKDNPYEATNIELEAGIAFLNIGDPKSRVILDAQKFYAEQLPKNDERLIEAIFFAGKYYAAQKEYEKAINNWRANIALYESHEGAPHPLALNTHAYLINALEKTGQSEEATKHCFAISVMTPWDDNHEQRALFRPQARYPTFIGGKKRPGWVKVDFIVSEVGTVKNAKVIKSKGGTKFEKSALAAIERFRYAPKFENGKPIETNHSVKLIFPKY